MSGVQELGIVLQVGVDLGDGVTTASLRRHTMPCLVPLPLSHYDNITAPA